MSMDGSHWHLDDLNGSQCNMIPTMCSLEKIVVPESGTKTVHFNKANTVLKKVLDTMLNYRKERH